ncbi:MAG: tRNA (N6-isopentenyl adenosine(37)-C2)-methylthiotransferase MiaB [Kiritimatiellia bacterium]
MPPTYHLWTIGCQMNEADSRHLGSQLEALGFAATDDGAAADLIVLNTCVVRQQAEDRAVGRLQQVRKAKESNPGMMVGLMGCMVGLKESARLREQFPFVDVFMPPSDTAPLMSFLSTKGFGEEARLLDLGEKAVRDAIQDGDYRLPAPLRGRAAAANVPIVLGCSHACTFCVIPYRRGPERSRPAADILREVRSLAAQGVREIMLLGQIVDRYGCDFAEPYDLAGLLGEISAIDSLLRIRFLTGHPNYMTDRILAAVRDLPKVCPQLDLPVQAGSDRVLLNMRRGYTADDYRRLIHRARAIVPDAAIHTDVIVGFPGETEEDVQASHRLLEELELDKVHLAKYSVRPKTIAARTLPDDVPPEEKERRRVLLDDLQERIQTRKNAPLLGTQVEVLVEDEVGGRWRGRTPHSRMVLFTDPRPLRGALVRVKVVQTGPWSLVGEEAHILAPPFETPAEATPPRRLSEFRLQP